ncbi:GNAT family N-acetyltransferase [Flindersiella endophytica]
MLIRECTAGDLEALERLSPSGLNREHARKLERQLAGEETYLLGWLEARLAGSGAVLWQGCTDPAVRAAFPDCPEIYGLHVEPRLRGRGIGTALVREAEARAERRGFRRVGISVDLDNSRAARLYERLGYHAAMEYRGAWHYLDDQGAQHVTDEPAIFLLKHLPAAKV